MSVIDLSELKTKIESFRDLKPGWDSYGARPIDPHAIDRALRLVDDLEQLQVFPENDGGIVFESPRDLLISLSPGEKDLIFTDDD